MLSADIGRSLRRATGLALTATTVERAIRQRMKQCAITRLDAYLNQLDPCGDEWSALIELVVVPETWFFRDAPAFGAAVQCARDMLASARRPVSILSVPCATGEEPFSLAMALLDAGIAATDFRIEAIDISVRALEHAARGIYGRNAFRTADLRFRERHFTRTEHGYELNRQVRDCVTFSPGNLLKLDMHARAESYDLIFCRNLLIYFDEATQQEAVSRLNVMLRDDGMLFAGYAEVPVFHQNRFVSTRHPMAFGLKKACEAAPQKHVVPKIPSPDIRAARAVAPPRQIPQPAVRPGGLPQRLLPVQRDEALNVGALLEQARALADRGDYRTAGARLAECLRYKPDCADANLLFGLVSERNGDLRAAESHVRRAIYLDPQHYQALCHLALLEEKQGNVASASAVRERAARVYRRLRGGLDDKRY